MPTDFATEIADGLAEIRSELGEQIVLVRKSNGNRITIKKAVKTNPVAETSTAQGTARRTQTDEFLIAVSELVDRVTAFRPAQDDKLEYTAGSVVRHYRLQPFGGSRGGNVYEYTDAGETEILIHCDFVKDVSV